MTLGERVRMIRKRKGITQTELAAAMRVAQSHMSKIEGNVVAPKAETILKIAKALDVPVSELIGV